MKASTYAWSATAASAVIPFATFVWTWATYDFYGPDGMPDNTLIHNLPAIGTEAVVLWLAALLAFVAVGELQRRRPKPSLAVAAVFTGGLAFLLSAAFYALAVFAWPDRPMPGSAITTVWLFAWSWACLGLGAATQCLRMRAR